MHRVGALVMLAFIAACSFDGSVPGDDTGDDGMTPGVWRVDTEADFRAPGSRFAGAITTAPGAITVGRYAHGVLAAAGRTGCGIGPGQQATIAWADVIAAPIGRGFGVPNRPFTGGVPAGLGLAGDMFTAWWEGELWLEAGTHGFHLLADDRAFVEVLVAGGWQRVGAEGDAAGDIIVPAAGWYPVHIAHAECGGAESLAILHRAPGASDEVPLSEARLRAIVNGANGLVASAFDDRALLVPVGDVAAIGPLVSADWAADRPPDVGITDGETFSVRWAGQLRIDAGGDYTFHIHSDNGHRLRIDGVVVLDFMSFGATVEDRVSPVISLLPGWHDIVLDYQEDTGLAVVDFSVASGPDLVGMAIPVDRLRPMPGTAGRLIARTITRDVEIPDLATATVPIRIDAPAGATVDRVNFGYTLDHSAISDLVITLTSPAGTSIVARNRASASSPLTDRWLEQATFAGQDPSGVWTLTVQDAASLDSGTLHQVAVTVHYTGGDPAQPATAVWESDVHPLGSVRSIDRLSWTAAVPGASAVELAIRTCPAPDACTGEYVPVPASGDAPAVPTARYAQLRATLAPAGDDLPSIDAIELDYTP